MEATRNRINRCRPNRTKRHGVSVLQLVLVLPVLFLTLVAGIQFASMLAINSTISAAANEASRLAAMRCSRDQIEDRVNELLNVHGMMLGDCARLVLINDAGGTQSFGNPALVPTLGSTPPSGMVRAVLVVSMDCSPAPNLLVNYCVDFSGRNFEYCSTSTYQCSGCET